MLPPRFNYCRLFESNIVDEISDFNFDIGNLDMKEKNVLTDLLNSYRDCISFSMKDLGKMGVVEMHIKCITDDPVVYRPYHMSIAEKEILSGIISDLLANGII